MRKYVFITPEGFTYQPNSESIEPDVENLQVIGFGEGQTAGDALRQLLSLNGYLLKTNFDEIIAVQLANDDREWFSLREMARAGGAGLKSGGCARTKETTDGKCGSG